jgi:hypothetical protein
MPRRSLNAASRSLALPALAAVLMLGAVSALAQQRSPEEIFQFENLTRSKPFQRYWWAWYQRAYPAMEIPAGVLVGAWERQHASKARGVAATAGTFRPIGPRPIDAGDGIKYSGRVGDVAIDPTNANRWLIGGAHGGIWETSDAGVSWTPLTDDQASLAMGAIAFAPSNPQIVYAGTGEAAFAGDAYGGAGILKSTDGGASWTLVADDTFSKRSFADIHVDPTDPDTLVVAVTRGLVGSFSGSSSLPVGVFKSVDGGAMWSHNLMGEDGTDLEVDAANFDRQYAGLGETFGGTENGVYRSTDGGDNWAPIAGPWTILAGGIGRVEMAMSPTDPDVLYVGIQDAFDNVGADGNLLGLWKTTNAWDPVPTWSAFTAPAGGICSPQCWYDFELKVDRLDSGILLAGGVSMWRFDGTLWSNVSSPSSMHVDQHTMAWAGSRLVAGNDGGVWSSTDGGVTWSNHNADLALTQYYHGSLHPTDPELTIAGSQDNGTHLWTGADEWAHILGGDGADNAISTADPDLSWAASFQGQVIQRTLNGGVFFTTAALPDTVGAPFIGVFKSCAAMPDVFIAGTDNLWRTTDFFVPGTPTWVMNSPEMGEGLRAMAFAPSVATCSTYAFGTGSGVLRITTNAGASYQDLDPSGEVPDRFITDMAFDPNDADHLIVTVSGFATGEGHVFETANATAATPTWTDVSPPADLPVNAIVITADGQLFAATDLGVWLSFDGGGSWLHLGPTEGLPNSAVYDLQYSAVTDTLVAYTHGRGAFARVTRIFLDGFESGDTSAWPNTVP